ncbi:MAG: D-serine deaminase-like pyridoxal phosphate-dependent protein [Verrucomicrobiales bacterium]|jgi:D-serine deaminase-like pyridoxal phosphate-dependent protein
MSTQPPPFHADAFDEIPSPSLLVWPDRVRKNIVGMISQVEGDVARLRPHVKTHKMAEVVRLQLEAGIDQFKCATIAEAEMLAMAGARDVLLAYQPVGPNVGRLAMLAQKFPATSFAALVDDLDALAVMDARFASEPKPLRLFVDVDCGMGRTGVATGARELCEAVSSAGSVALAGLHVYDGHLHQAAVDERRAGFEAARVSVQRLIDEVQPDLVIGGGSPTFGLHAMHANWQCSPGTTLFWDVGYGGGFPDLDFEIAAALLVRVISKPGENLLCLDLGHKAVGAENPLENRVRFPGLSADLEFVLQSEEHLVVKVPNAGEFSVGDALLGLPIHICPTVALHMEGVIVSESGQPSGERWEVAARDRRLTI